MPGDLGQLILDARGEEQKPRPLLLAVGEGDAESIPFLARRPSRPRTGTRCRRARARAARRRGNRPARCRRASGSRGARPIVGCAARPGRRPGRGGGTGPASARRLARRGRPRRRSRRTDACLGRCKTVTSSRTSSAVGLRLLADGRPRLRLRAAGRPDRPGTGRRSELVAAPPPGSRDRRHRTRPFRGAARSPRARRPPGGQQHARVSGSTARPPRAERRRRRCLLFDARAGARIGAERALGGARPPRAEAEAGRPAWSSTDRTPLHARDPRTAIPRTPADSTLDRRRRAVDDVVDAIGHVPLPPYIRRGDRESDRRPLPDDLRRATAGRLPRRRPGCTSPIR